MKFTAYRIKGYVYREREKESQLYGGGGLIPSQRSIVRLEEEDKIKRKKIKKRQISVDFNPWIIRLY